MKLVFFLMKMRNETVTVELKNGSVIHGTIEGVDINMNMHLKNAKVSFKGRLPQELDTFTVRGNTITQIILPNSLQVDNLLVDDAMKKVVEPREQRIGAAPPAARGRGRGRGR
eukprot:snap_masked-scaffold_15-processed-gene-1.19-mRNA-1 protein AED:0.06 eAED:0.06 QI:0/-1/0/1/-1/1/1/0/112